MKVKIYNFLSTLFQKKDFISQENPILPVLKDIVFCIPTAFLEHYKILCKYFF